MGSSLEIRYGSVLGRPNFRVDRSRSGGGWVVAMREARLIDRSIMLAILANRSVQDRRVARVPALDAYVLVQGVPASLAAVKVKVRMDIASSDNLNFTFVEACDSTPLPEPEARGALDGPIPPQTNWVTVTRGVDGISDKGGLRVPRSLLLTVGKRGVTVVEGEATFSSSARDALGVIPIRMLTSSTRTALIQGSGGIKLIPLPLHCEGFRCYCDPGFLPVARVLLRWIKSGEVVTFKQLKKMGNLAEVREFEDREYAQIGTSRVRGWNMSRHKYESDRLLKMPALGDVSSGYVLQAFYEDGSWIRIDSAWDDKKVKLSVGGISSSSTVWDLLVALQEREIMLMKTSN